MFPEAFIWGISCKKRSNQALFASTVQRDGTKTETESSDVGFDANRRRF